MVKWEYEIRTVPEGKLFIEDLNTFGARGWELVSVLLDSEFWLIFKRPVVGCKDIETALNEYDAAIEDFLEAEARLSLCCDCSACRERREE